MRGCDAGRRAWVISRFAEVSNRIYEARTKYGKALVDMQVRL